MFSLTQFGRMITDGVRHEAHVAALERYVRPDSVVLDVGTGSGIYALIAAKLGARKVYAIDPNPYVQVGRELAQRNGLSDRIEFRCGLSTDVTLPEQADLIVSDLRDTLPFNGTHFSAVADARRRHLAPGGVMIPTRDTVHMALVEAPTMRKEIAGPWEADQFGLDLSIAVDHEANVPRSGRVAPEALLSAPVRFAELDYVSAVDTDLESAEHHLDVTVPAERSGTVHAIAVWFDAVLVDEIGYSSGPFGPYTVYGTRLLPLRIPVTVEAGDSIHLYVRCRYLSDWHWWWSAEVSGAHGVQRAALGRQTTMRAGIITDEMLRLMLGRTALSKTDDLERDLFILERLSCGASVPEVALEFESTRRLPAGSARATVLQVASRYAGV